MRDTLKKNGKKIAMAMSLCAILLWSVLGAGTSLAWFADTSPKVRNVFHFGEFDLTVSVRRSDGSYKELDGQTKIFDDQALYEPGYVQVAYLKIENKGSVPFNFRTAVSVADYTVATNAFGGTFLLQNYLRFGIVTGATEAEMLSQLSDRDMARQAADMPLNTYATDYAPLAANEEMYMALVVCMPEHVGNEANYRGDVIPTVELGVIVSAQQQTTVQD